MLAAYDLDAAYRVLENEELPGWLSMPKNEATTIWEAWEGPKSAHGGIGSLNHYSKGAVCRWLFDTMCGIHVDGENHFTLAPRPGGRFTRAKAAYESVYGLVECGWEQNNGSFCFTAVIPANCTATLILPDGARETLAPGRHTYRR